ncbi:MAG TPA: PQQ-binding-like beta-propeller repeat protein [Armatimonadota bacterium]|nr:PQQ-binding-like beta-propeller repeat protein [Armatimonadota bacterium]
MKLYPLLITALLCCGLAGGVATAETAPGRRVLAADYSTRRIALLKPDGTVKWQQPVEAIHDLHRLPNGNILFQRTFTHLVEVDPRTDKVVWEYDAGRMNGNEGRRVEVHAFQRLRNGDTMIAESGPARIIEVDPSGKLVRQVPLKVNRPNPHSDTRLVRKLESGNYLVCHEADGAVREYSPDGKVVWEYAVPLFGKERRDGHGPEAYGNQVFAAVRLKGGNTLISTGNGHGVLEVTPEGQIVWNLHQNDLPGITLAWVTTLQVRPNGNIILGNCHAGPSNPQLIEVTRDKQVVWTFKDFERFGDALSNSLVLLPKEKSLR